MASPNKDNLSDQFHDQAIHAQIDLLRYSEDVRQKVLSFMQDLQTDLQSQIAGSGVSGPPSPDQLRRAQSLINQSQSVINSAYDQSAQLVNKELLGMAQVENQRAAGHLNDTIRGQITTPVLNQKQLEELVSDSWINGSPAGAWWQGQSKQTRDAFAQQVQLGVAQGQTNDQIVNRIIGQKTGRKIPITDPKTGKVTWVDEYSRGILDTSRRNATALVRTAVQTISNNVLYWTYLENQDVLKGIQWLSTLDHRTTPLCRSRDKCAWNFKGDPLPASPKQIRFPGPPPAHWNCRSVIIPITKSWNQLITEAHGEKAEVSNTEAKQRVDQAAAAGGAEDGQAPAPVPVQKMDLGKNGLQQVTQLARQVDPVTVHPADLRLTSDKLDYQKVTDAITSDSRSGVIAVRDPANGKLYVVKGQEKVAAAVYSNEGQIEVRVVDMPKTATKKGPEIPAPAVPPPSHGLAPAITEGPLPVSTRASMDGQVASDLSYETWLKSKSAAFQDEILGSTKARLFRQGKVGLSDLVSMEGRPLTLEEIESKILPDLTVKDLADEWEGFKPQELVRLAGKLDLSPAETRLLLASLGVAIPNPSVLYYHLQQGWDNRGVPTLDPDQMQQFQSTVELIKAGKIKFPKK